MKCFLVTFTDAAQYKRIVYMNCRKDYIEALLPILGCQVLEITEAIWESRHDQTSSV